MNATRNWFIRTALCAAFAGMGALAYAQDVTLVAPADGATVPLLSADMKNYLTMDRAERIDQVKVISQFLIDDTAALFLGYPDYSLVSTARVSDLLQYAVDWYLIDKDVTVTTVRELP